jgi:hypothetical protein
MGVVCVMGVMGIFVGGVGWKDFVAGFGAVGAALIPMFPERYVSNKIMVVRVYISIVVLVVYYRL